MNAKAVHTENQPKKNLSIPVIHLPMIAAVIFFILLTVLPEPSGKAVTTSLKMCAERLIPTLFPFMVASELLLGLGFSEIVGKILGKPFSHIFGLNECGAAAFVIGSLCGLPLGGRYALGLLRSGSITERECEKLIAISTNAGIGFTVIGIGHSLWGSISLGWLIYGAQIFASVTVGAILFRREKTASIAPATAEKTKLPFPYLLCDAISKSLSGILTVCAFAVFFTTLSALISHLCVLLSLPPILGATAGAFSELASGTLNLRDLALSNAPVNENSALILTFFAVGFSGMSVHAQILSLCRDHGIKMKKYFLMKLASGLICALTGAIVMHFIAF